MNKLVYLYELDSKNNTDYEIELGQKALFEEIVLNGNKVILTFNQLTDSFAFLSAIKNKETYDYILKLFSIGSIKISRFNEIRTASQYVQNAIDKCLSDDRDSFIFSGLPVSKNDEDLLLKIKNSLKYSDLSILNDEISKLKNNSSHNSDEIERMEYIYRFVNMLLVLSKENLSNNLPKMNIITKKLIKPKKYEKIFFNNYNNFFNKNLAYKYNLLIKQNKINKFTFFMDKLFFCYEKRNKYIDFRDNILSSELLHIIGKSIDFLKNIKIHRCEYCYVDKCKKCINNRSIWIEEIYKKISNENICEKEDYVVMAELIIDILYNYTSEDSILGISKHYLNNSENMFWKDFQKRVEISWKKCNNNLHILNRDNYDKKIKDTYSLPRWDLAWRLLEKANRNKILKQINTKDLYETNYYEEKKYWFKVLDSMISKHILIIAFYIIAFIILQGIMDFIENIFIDTVKLNSNFLLIIDIIIFSLFSSWITEFLKIPDILETFKEMIIDIKDMISYKKIESGVSYNNIERNL